MEREGKGREGTVWKGIQWNAMQEIILKNS
jgi:hypothetical protein